jgi:hypothetical protein
MCFNAWSSYEMVEGEQRGELKGGKDRGDRGKSGGKGK